VDRETLVIAGGGTGGHLYPGIAVAEELQRRRPGAEIVFAGAGLPLEREILERHGFRHLAIPSGGLIGKTVAGRARGAWLAFRGLLQAIQALLKMKPKAVIGVGGYASGPMVLAAVMLRLPTLIQEQNYYPGLTNRWLAPWVRRVAVSFEETRHYLGGRGEVTGNPIRTAFRDLKRKTRGEAFHVLIFGGSQGARTLNTAVIDALGIMEPQRLGLRITHGTGPSDFERVRAAYEKHGYEALVLPYIARIREAYERADLVVARAGASSVAEIAACGRASILVPLAASAHDHQRFNARKAAAAGAAVMIEEKDLTGESLARAILALRDDPTRLLAMERAAAALARPEAAARVADLVEELIA
jgi:UDP-N-acetylglucosamine--N-acetylmuramyl-(pentapeptide) pyrophosphoryl-undecaprenol N-acetylglucosamine transferase